MSDDQRGAGCEFVRGDGPPTCDRPAESLEMYDGGTVIVCDYHRSWIVAMARIKKITRD